MPELRMWSPSRVSYPCCSLTCPDNNPSVALTPTPTSPIEVRSSSRQQQQGTCAGEAPGAARNDGDLLASERERLWSAAGREARYCCVGSVQCPVSSVQCLDCIMCSLELRLKTGTGDPSKTTGAHIRKDRERLRSAARRAKQQR